MFVHLNGLENITLPAGTAYFDIEVVFSQVFELIRRLQVETHLNALGDLLQRLAVKHAVRTFRIRGELTAWLAFMFSA